jgi:hypothetical protein
MFRKRVIFLESELVAIVGPFVCIVIKRAAGSGPDTRVVCGSWFRAILMRSEPDRLGRDELLKRFRVRRVEREPVVKAGA